MSMEEKEFKKIINNYIEKEDVVLTNARGFWEKAPITKCLILNKGLHILLKKDALESLKDDLRKSSDEDKMQILEEFCADINMPNRELIKNILENMQ